MHNGRERASDSDKERPDNNGVFAAGDLAVLIDRKDRRFLVRLQPGRVAGSDAFGPLPHEAIIGRPPGSRLPAGPGRSVLCLRPTLEDYVLHMPRRSQVLYPKDLGLILSLGDVRPQSRVFEAGVGSGAVSVALLSYLAPGGGRLVSYEVRADMAELARENVHRWLGTDVPWELRLRDVYEGIEEGDFDVVFLDLPEPWRCAASAARALRPGGVLLAWVPTALQVYETVTAMRAEPLLDCVEAFESLLRPWHVGGRSVRPVHRMVAHTGFLVRARRVLPWEQVAGNAGGDSG